MRRIQSTSLPRFLRSEEAPPKDVVEQPGPWRASFELRSITPILGGGVQSFEPDQVDVVRVPAIRGHLRWWWRGLYQSWGDDADRTVADALFAREAELWGGVGVPGHTREGAKESPGLRSRVRITVDLLALGQVKPAGSHKWNDRGNLKAVPDWQIGSKLGYALFPLQRPQRERQKHEEDDPARTRELPTREIREGLQFRLRVAVPGAQPGSAPEKVEVAQVLAAVWAWIFFGGLGARTRRGFGALELSKAPEIAELPSIDHARWSRLFQAPQERDIPRWLEELEALASPAGRLWPFQLLLGKPMREAARAHQEMVGHLKDFRQAPGFARDPGSPRPGQSRWPEPHLLRTLAPPGRPFDHSPSPDAAAAVRDGEVGAPRAAFGLPILVQFKDHGDQRANATLSPLNAQRWPSPLLLRPLRLANGQYASLTVRLPLRPPATVSVIFDAGAGNDDKTCAVAKSAGARVDIARFLKAARGDALQAFEDWLIRDRGFQRVALGEKGASHA